MEPEIRARTILGMRVAGVKDARAIRFPSRAAAPGWILDPWNAVGQGQSGLRVIEMQRALLAGIFGQADRHQFAVRGWHEPIDGDMAFGFQFVGIEQNPFRDRIRGRGQCQDDQQALLFRRLELEGKETAWPRDESAIGRRDLPEQGGQLREDAGPALDRVEMTPRAAVLGVCPRLHGGIIAVLQPAEFIHYLDSMMCVADGMVGAGGIWSGGWEYERVGHGRSKLLSQIIECGAAGAHRRPRGDPGGNPLTPGKGCVR